MKKNFHDFFIESKRNDIFANLDAFYEYLEEAKSTKEYAYRRTLASATSSTVVVEGAGEMIMLGSNNYLDLAANTKVVNAAQAALAKYGNGSGSVALLGGTFDLHRKLETKIATFYSRELAAIFPTGFSTNIGTISSLICSNDLLLLDTYSHASLIEGTKLTRATVKFFKHNDMEHLEKLLIKLRSQYDGVLIVTDGIFSMDGDICPLDKLIALKQKYNARLMIDEAHAIGIVGDHGRGTEEYFHLTGAVDIITGTLSKAPGGIGGYVVGSKKLVEYIRHFASSYIFSTSLPPAVVGGLIEVFNILENDLSHKEKLDYNKQLFTARLRELGFNIGQTISAIVPIIIGDEEKTKLMARELAEEKIFCSAVVFPAVSKTQSRLRISLMCSHSEKQLLKVL